MDPIVTPAMLTAALTKLLNSAATEAGAKSWDALKALIARRRGHAPDRPGTEAEATVLAEDLAAAAAQDPDLAGELAAWHRSWQQSIVGSNNVTNNMTGEAENVVQGRDFGASITFN